MAPVISHKIPAGCISIVFLIARLSWASPAATQALITPRAVLPRQLLTNPYQTNCDGAGILTCGLGTCYTGISASSTADFIGCCSAASCAPRTTCYDYNPTASPQCTDINSDGCLACTNPAAPSCVTFSNTLANQYALWCDTTGGLKTTGYAVVAGPTSSTSSMPTTSASSTCNLSGTAQEGQCTVYASSDPAHGYNGLSKGALAGIIIGSILGALALLCCLPCCLLRMRRRRRARLHPSSMVETSNGMGGYHQQLTPQMGSANSTTTAGGLHPETATSGHQSATSELQGSPVPSGGETVTIYTPYRPDTEVQHIPHA